MIIAVKNGKRTLLYLVLIIIFILASIFKEDINSLFNETSNKTLSTKQKLMILDDDLEDKKP